ncbi:MAG: cytochrome P450 [Actinomycetota bacterium]|nr:cytochrome P450 [Actinomycetota bacterium]
MTELFDPHDLGFIANPYPAYAELRARGRIHYHEGTNQWIVPHHADVGALLRDRRFGRTYLHLSSHQEMGRPEDVPEAAAFWKLIRDGILDMEPPDHTRVRRLVAKAFTPRFVEGLRTRIRSMTEGLADRLEDLGEGDLIATVAEPLPVNVIAELLGIPEGDRHHLRPWSADICRMYELDPTEEDATVASRAAVEFSDYLRALIRERRAAPTEDLIGELVQVLEEGERLTEDEMIGTCVLLLNAGHEATVNVTGNGWWSLFRNPEQLARLRAEPSLAPTAIEELMRYDTPLQMFERWVLDDVEIAGTRVPRGQELALLFGSANRDPAVFDRPDELDVQRSPNPHMSFGAGVHFCLGAPLARLELGISFGTLLRRFPRMELVAEPEWKPNYIIRGLKELRVRV